MDKSNLLQSQFEVSRNVNDLQGLETLRKAALKGDEGALQEAAQQFESIFVQMMIKSMRKASEVLSDEDSPFNSQNVKFYQDMHDQQLASSLSASGSIGLADIVVKQLSQHLPGSDYQSANVVRGDGNLAEINARRERNLEQIQERYIRAEESQGRPAKIAAFTSPEEFVETLLPEAKKVAHELGIDPLAVVAQAAVETGWGQHMIHKNANENAHNLFGIKADARWEGEKASIETLEFRQGVAQKEKADFRAYDSFEAGLRDYVDFIKQSPRYAKALENGGDSDVYFKGLQEAGYATDPQYAAKIKNVLKSPTLRTYANDAE
jgi:flagellar protein FlgJ